MRILWFCGNSGRYEYDIKLISTADGTWISSLQEKLISYDHIKLGLVFQSIDNKKETLGKTTYYTIKKCPKWNKLFPQKEELYFLNQAEKIINDFNPDIIHVFGSETELGLIYRITQTPIILHIQGFIGSVINAWYPPYYNKCYNDLKKLITNPLNLLNILHLPYRFNYITKREQEIFEHINNFFGRTEWDKRIAKLLNPEGEYYYCSEMIRSIFYNNEKKWEYNKNNYITIISTINESTYKGQDVILKTAKLLKNLGYIINWKICGISNIEWATQQTNIKYIDVNVELLGKVSSETIKNLLLQCNCYVHPSYIENSPNSICEAQLIGVPVISCNVGGISSIINHNIDGILVPSNDIYMLASHIIEIYNNKSLATFIGNNGYKVAKNRHKPENIVSDLLKSYNHIIEKSKL